MRLLIVMVLLFEGVARAGPAEIARAKADVTSAEAEVSAAERRLHDAQERLRAAQRRLREVTGPSQPDFKERDRKPTSALTKPG